MNQVGQRRPKLHEMERITTRHVKPLVEIKSKQVIWKRGSERLKLNLIWVERNAGTFGPGSAAYARQMRLDVRRNLNLSRLDKMGDISDRGKRTAWLLFFSCPNCLRRCRVLYSLIGMNEFGCVKCNRPAYASNSWPCTGRRNARGISRMERGRLKCMQTAARARKVNGLSFVPLVGDLAVLSESCFKKPSRMTWVRFEELALKIELCEKEALLFSLRSAACSLSKV